MWDEEDCADSVVKVEECPESVEGGTFLDQGFTYRVEGERRCKYLLSREVHS